MRVPAVVLLLLLVVYGCLVPSMSIYMANRPVVVRLGYVPSAEILKLVAGDQKTFIAELSIVKLIFYFGSLVEEWKKKIMIPPEYYNMFKTAQTAVKLDPYNMDAYYFSEAAFTWEVGHAADVNKMLIYGMKFRSWDWYLPYFVGFNSAYFLKDFNTAPIYMKKAAELSGNQLFTQLSARYFYESDKNKLAIDFLKNMIAKENDKKIKNAYSLRLAAIEHTLRIETAIEKYKEKFKRSPKNLNQLVLSRILKEIPHDPYGGKFFLDEKGKVRSSSNFIKVD